MIKKTACGLDCWDACSLEFDGDKIKPSRDGFTNGVLCSLLNSYIHKEKRIEKPTIDGIEVSMQEALEEVAKSLKDNSLLWRGSGNIGVMQEVTNLLFKELNDSTLTKGSLCDGSGDAGIIQGRGINRMLPLKQIKKSEVVVVWGRNITTTNSHLLPLIKDKKIIVIDPIKTNIAKLSNLHIQIKPRSDFYFALIVCRFIIMQDEQNVNYLEEFATEYEDFYDFTRGYRVKAILNYIGLSLGDMGEFINLISNKKVVYLVGAGVQKYSIGDSVLRMIDSIAIILGQIGQEGCGVGFLGDSKLGYNNPFKTNSKKVQKANTKFSNFKTVLVQGGNPAHSMPNSSKVIYELQKVDNLIYFGLYENETSKLSRVVIPALNFFEKNDVRLSYNHYSIQAMNQITKSSFGISEYNFTKEILKILNINTLKEEDEYIKDWLNQSPSYQKIPYCDGFGEDGDEEFEFMDDFDDDFIEIKQFIRPRKRREQEDDIKKYWLITPKASNSLNSQFKRIDYAIIHPNCGFKDNEIILVSSEYGELKLFVKCSEDIREDSVLISSNCTGVNILTPDIISEEGDNACYQEVMVKIDLLKD